MSAMILLFPSKADAMNRLALLTSHLQRAIPLPHADQQLGQLIRQADELLNQMDYAALDDWLDDLDAWENSLTSQYRPAS